MALRDLALSKSGDLLINESGDFTIIDSVRQGNPNQIEVDQGRVGL